MLLIILKRGWLFGVQVSGWFFAWWHGQSRWHTKGLRVSIRKAWIILSCNITLWWNDQGADASRWRSASMKKFLTNIVKNYNKNHKALSLNIRDKVYICLNNEYKLCDISKAKLELQKVEPFKIINKIRQQAFELQFPIN